MTKAYKYLVTTALFIFLFTLFFIVPLEPIVHDGWGVLVHVKDKGFFEITSLFFNKFYMAGNPRLGQFFTLLSYSGSIWHYLISPLSVIFFFLISYKICFRQGFNLKRLKSFENMLLLITLICLTGGNVGLMFFYRPFLTNYITGFILILVLYDFIIGEYFDDNHDISTLKFVLYCITSIIAGLTNEHTVPIFLLIATAILFLRAKNLKNRSLLISIITLTFIGFLFLYFAPGQSVRYDGAGKVGLITRVLTNLPRTPHIFYKYALSNRFVFLILFGILSFQFFIKKERSQNLLLNCILIISSILTVALLLAGHGYGPRLFFATSIFLSFISLRQIEHLPIKTRKILNILCPLVVISFSLISVHRYTLFNREFKSRQQIVKSSQGEAVTLSPYRTPNGYFTWGEDLFNDWAKKMMEEYFQKKINLEIEKEASHE